MELAPIIESFAQAGLNVFDKIFGLFASPSSTVSVWSLSLALLIAAAHTTRTRWFAKRPVSWRVIRRALFPRKLYRSASTRADVLFLVFNTGCSGLLFGWALMSMHFVSNAAANGLTNAFGAMPATGLSVFWSSVILTIVVFLAYDIGYWFDHYTSHAIPFFWEFHKVHHTAEILSPLTNARLHPIDGVKFTNILALFMGTGDGVAHYLLGNGPQEFKLFDQNAIFLAFMYLLVHLQHTHLWIAFTGFWGHVIVSPAHHQIHHSMNPIHFNKNLGSTLSVWDWLFGTLHLPSKKRETLTFGVEHSTAEVHTLTGSLLHPVRDAGLVLWRSIARVRSREAQSSVRQSAPSPAAPG